MPSKFGGVPVEGSKFGGVPVDDKAPTSLLPSSQPPAVGRFLTGFGNAVNPVPGIKQMTEEASNPSIGLRSTLGRHFIDPQTEQFSKAKDAVSGTGEFEHMPASGRMMSAAGHAAAGILPLVGPAAANAGEQIGSGDVAGGLGSGAGLIASMAAPSAIGKGMKAAAEPLAETAMGIRNLDRAPNKMPGRAVLDETSGVRPGTISQQAGQRIADLSQEQRRIVGASPAQPSLRPALDVGENAIAKARAGNSESGHLEPMVEQLTKPRQGFAGRMAPINQPPAGAQGPSGPIGITETQSAPDFLNMRQRFGNDFTKFDTARPLSKEALRTGNQMYGKMTDELHSQVPDLKPVDTRISNLIPARDATHVRDLNAGLPQRMMGRFGAHTGALAGALYGGHEFGLPGAVAGIAIPELLADPTAQMIAARGADYSGKALSHPMGRATTPIPSLIKQRSKEKQ